MDKFICVVALVSLVGVVIIGFVAKPVITGVALLAIVIIGWHDDYYLPRTHR